MTELTEIPGADPRFNESRQAVKALVAVMFKRFPDHVATIESWFDGYVDVLCGVVPNQRPILNPEQIMSIGREVMNGWSSRMGKFPRPKDFIEARDERAVVKKLEPGKSNEIRTLMSIAKDAGVKAYDWNGNDVLGPFWEGKYREYLQHLDQADQLAVKRNVADYIDMYFKNRVRSGERKPGGDTPTAKRTTFRPIGEETRAALEKMRQQNIQACQETEEAAQ